MYVPGDICSFATINAVAKKAIDTYGYIDCWVNNAGSADPKDVGPAIDMTEEAYDRVVDRCLPYAYRKQGAFDTKTFDEETLIVPLGRNGIVEHLMVAVIPGDLASEPGKVLL